VIVSEKIYDTFLNKLVERTKKIKVGPSDDPNNYMGPVVERNGDEGNFELHRGWGRRKDGF